MISFYFVKRRITMYPHVDPYIFGFQFDQVGLFDFLLILPAMLWRAKTSVEATKTLSIHTYFFYFVVMNTLITTSHRGIHHLFNLSKWKRLIFQIYGVCMFESDNNCDESKSQSISWELGLQCRFAVCDFVILSS